MEINGYTIGAGVNLSWASLPGATLHHSYLRGANLHGANLSRANLCSANLSGADLREVNLRWSMLCGADLSWANLWMADLRRANLLGADLRFTQLCRADLRWTDLRGALLGAATMMLLANWGSLSDELTADLLNYEAASHPQPSLFYEWANGDLYYPYDRDRLLDRAAHFKERRECWLPDRPPVRPYELMLAVFRECGVIFNRRDDGNH